MAEKKPVPEITQLFDCPYCGSDRIAEKRLYFNEEETAVELVEFCCDCNELLHDNIWWEDSDVIDEILVH